MIKIPLILKTFNVSLPQVVVLFATLLSGCASAPLDKAGSLLSYSDLDVSDGLVTHSLVHIRKEDVLAARTARILPTVFSVAATKGSLGDDQRSLIANAIDRSVCYALAGRFNIVAADAKADLTVHAVVTNIVPTDVAFAGISKVAAVVPTVLLSPAPVLVPRIPFGLGSLSVEAEARDGVGIQKAAMVWARGADSFTSQPRMANDGDAYDLATTFGFDFGEFLVTGATPFGKMASLPTAQRISETFGGAPKSPVCEAYGRLPGIAGIVGSNLGAPPDWTDHGAPKRAPPNG